MAEGGGVLYKGSAQGALNYLKKSFCADAKPTPRSKVGSRHQVLKAKVCVKK
jgi:hypothetical protein